LIVDIEKLRADLAAETRRFTILAIIGAVTIAAASFAVATYLARSARDCGL
jgi:hypothetical protein